MENTPQLRWRYRFHNTIGRPLVALVAAAWFTTSCTSVPEHMQVRSGVDPRNQDDQVRFRTTYYFRVYDICAGKDGEIADSQPKLDSLYRFRMTGKASALFSKVHFESGVLQKNEIDPFGADVVFDDKLGRFRFVSRQETDELAWRNAQYDEINRRIKLLLELEAMLESQQAGAHPSSTITQTRDNLTESIGNLIANLDPPTRGEPKPNGNGLPGAKRKEQMCPPGTKLARGFQILGPEGVRTFNQDERLIMAMTSSGKPIIGALKELAGRMLAEQQGGPEALLPLVNENMKILRAERELDRLERAPAIGSGEMVGKVLDVFNQEK